MNKENLLLLYIQIIDSIDTIYYNYFYDDINQIKSIRELLKKWFTSYKKTNSLIININLLILLNQEIINYYNNYSNKNTYVNRLYNNYYKLLEEWKIEIIKYLTNNDKNMIKYL